MTNDPTLFVLKRLFVVRGIYLFIFIAIIYFLPDVVKRGGHLRPLEQAALGHGQHLFREIPRRVISSLLARNLAFSSPTFAPTPTTALCCALFIWASISLCIYLCIYTFTHTSTYLDLSGLVLRLPSCPSAQTPSVEQAAVAHTISIESAH